MSQSLGRRIFATGLEWVAAMGVVPEVMGAIGEMWAGLAGADKTLYKNNKF